MTSLSRRLSGVATLPLALAGAPRRCAGGGPLRPHQPGARRALSEAYPVEGVGDGVTSAGYNQSRWVEDWTALRDPKKRINAIDRLKFIPLDPDGQIYLTLSGEMRLRMNLTTNPDMKDAQAQRQDIARIVGGADLHLGSHVRVYGELAHAGISGQNIGTPSGYLDNTMIVQQSFADATARVEGIDVGIRYGRQTFSDGPNLLIVPRDNNTIFVSYNGVRAWARAKTMRIDLFDFTPTRPGQQGTGDDLNADGRRFSGVTGGLWCLAAGLAVRSSISTRSTGACATRRRCGAAKARKRYANSMACISGERPDRSTSTGPSIIRGDSTTTATFRPGCCFSRNHTVSAKATSRRASAFMSITPPAAGLLAVAS
jgi:hypothetical protein